VSDDWLDKFRDDRQKPKPSEPGWLGRFRDDQKQGAPRNEPRHGPRNEPRRDAGRESDRESDRESNRVSSREPGREPGRGSANDPRHAPPAQPASPPRGRPMPRHAPQAAAPQSAPPKDRPQPAPRPSGAAPQPQIPRGLWGRPQDVLVFVSLMALSLALGLSATALALPRLMEIASPLEILLPDVLVITVTGAFVYAVAGLRQSWAIWLLIVFCVVRFTLYVPTFFHIDSVTVRMLTAMYFILQAAAFWFVFTPAAKRWFRAARK
jgi:hypothetical protein